MDDFMVDDFTVDDGSFFNMETIIPILIGLFFIIFFSVILIAIIQGIRTWNYNNQQPKLNVIAKVVSKRTEHSRSENSSSTWYYATFEVESSDRIEMGISGDEYGMLAEGDVGELTFQGSRYLGFKRV